MAQEGKQFAITCDLCSSTENVDSFCKNCKETLCEHCCEIHLKSVASRDHEIISRIQASASGIVDDMKCSYHGGKHYEMYCVTCDLVVCRRCVTDNHRGHEFDELHELFKRKPKEFENMIKAFNDKITPKYLKECELLEKKLSQIDAKQTVMESKIHSQAKDFKEGIHTVEEKFKRMLHGAVNAEKSAVRKLLMTRKANYAQIQKAINKMQTIFQSRHMTNLPLLLANMKRRIEAALLQEDIVVSSEMAFFEKSEIPLDKLETLFGSFCVGEADDTRKRTLPPVKTTVSIGKVIEMPILPKTDSAVSRIVIVSEKDLFVSSERFGFLITKEKGQVQTEMLKMYELQGPVAALSNGLLLALDGQNPNNIMQILSNHAKQMYLKAEFGKVTGIYASRKNEIFLSVTQEEDSCGEVLKYNKFKEMTMRIYEKESGEALFAHPTSLTENLNGDLWVIDADTNSVEVIDKYGLYRFSYTNSDILKYFQPHTLVNDSNANILISDTGNNTIHVVDRDGRALRYLDVSSLSIRPNGIAVEGPGQLWVVDSIRKSCYLLNYF
jgi:hypothetical protein